ncbi:MAG TPA: hypothetical protein VET48_00320, partial [Steroidobacteraceae bacterium]|nr:hypothetical protein [Steroidobacteraceae bacterium]
MKSLFVIASLVISTLPGFAQTTIPSILWQHSLGGSLDDIILSSSQTRDGGYILAGYTNSNDGDITTGHHGGDTIPDV